MASDPTGRRFVLERGDVRAEVTEVAASLRALSVGGIDLVAGFPDGMPAPGASGIVLVPWPNRVRDGRWMHDGREYRLAVTEPALNNAIHGLLRFTPYVATEEETGEITLDAEVFPQTGYPFHLDTSVTYALTEDGVTVTHRIENVGEDAAPVALGTHPYLRLGAGPCADLTIELDAATQFLVDDRLLPIGEGPVDAATDLRTPRRLGDLTLDTAYADIARGDDDRIRAVLRSPGGRAAELWAGPGFDYMQLFTNRSYPGADMAVAVEPMTAPADAFNSGRGLRWLAPDDLWTLEWGIRLLP
ncbi:aldose 1-epimerase family protein [Microbacterium candidum]|uniref:Aldose 1-epimerase family protein n=1 Tax=Microbacterium candidum TaxID=3041922 RepID=A0ABT7MUM6_9MICO|nr:aldose 1-epimerase family protein [Microbacterium sp. ASV49]MDL9978160.1 aldose 1-epimerase family protein [Microbacterium sp. ASV49]